MTISVHQGDMSEDDKPESSHEFNFFLDRQLQNKLLDVDEQLTSTENYLAQNHGVHYVSVGEGKSTFVKSQTKCEEITGWIQNSKTNFRKPDKENKPAKEFIQPWKDYKTKAQLDTYVFKHFKDPRYYIEQYRQDHALVLGHRSPVTRSELGSGGDLRRYAGRHSSPSPNSNGASNISTQNYVPPQPAASNGNNSSNGHSHSKNLNNNSTSTLSHNGNQLLTASMHYTNKKDTTSLPNSFTSSQNKFSNSSKNNSASLHNSHNNQNCNHGHQCAKHVHSQSDQGYKYKLAPEATWPRSESSQSTDHAEPRTPRIHSGKGDGRGAKMPTKVMVPAGVPNAAIKQNPLQNVTVQSKSPANGGIGDTTSHVTNAVPTGSVRTLDTLACVAADKQQCTERKQVSSLPQVDSRIDTDVSAPNTPYESLVSDAEPSDAVSLSKLSTTCLGAEVRVKADTVKVDSPCTFHVFPSDTILDVAPIVLNHKSVLWHPALSSTLVKKEKIQDELFIPSPFKGYLKAVVKDVDASTETEKLRNELKFAIKKTDGSKLDFPAIRSNGKNGLLVAADINLGNQAKFVKHRFSIQTSEYAAEPERRHSASFGKSRLFNTKNLKSRFAGYMKSKSTGSSRKNSGVHRSTSAMARPDHIIKSAKVYVDDHSDIPESIKLEVIEPSFNYWSNDNNNEHMKQEPNDSASTARIESIKKVAEYLLKDSNLMECFTPRDIVMPYGSELGKELAVGDGIDPEFQSSAAGLTWCERLEMLRAVNKRPEKTKQKPPKLRYYKDSPVSSHEPPGPLFSSRARLYEQRRIKHVLEQTKLKGADHYEWLSDGRVRRYRYQHSESSDDDTTTTDSSDYDDDEESLSSLSITTKSLSHVSTTNGEGNSSEKPQLQRYQVPPVVKGGGWKIMRSANTLQKSHSTL